MEDYSTLFSYLAGVVISLVFSYLPGVATWFNGLSGGYKRLLVLGVSLLVAAAYFGLGCTPLRDTLNITIACDGAGAQVAVLAFLKILIASQVTYTLTPSSTKG